MRAAVLSFFAFSTLSMTALADPTKDECIDADTRAQTLRTAGKLHDAQTQLAICVNQSCPAAVRQDCNERVDELSRVMPTVILNVKDASSGADLPATKVMLDGKPLVDQLDGKAIAIEPGDHAFAFTTAGHLPKTLQVVLKEGDKERHIDVVVGAVAAEPKTSLPPPPHEPPAEEPQATPGTGMRIAGIVVGAVGIVGIAVGAGFAAAAKSSWDTSKSECSLTSCTQRDLAVYDHDNAVGYATAATVGFVAGGLLAAGGLILFLVAPHKHADESSTSLRITPLLSAGGGGLILHGGFR